jgi:hypothetical protein
MCERVALYTFGVFTEPAENSVNDGFYELNDPILELVDKAPGLIARSGYDGDPGPESWGLEVYPPFYRERGDGWSPATLSLWTDLESVMAFSYYGLHAEALKRGREWFRKPQWPPYAVWWCDESHTPQWSEAVERHAHLHDHGPTARAFSFKLPFDASGKATQIDRERMKTIAGQNASGATRLPLPL